jgi:hypothetical protein
VRRESLEQFGITKAELDGWASEGKLCPPIDEKRMRKFEGKYIARKKDVEESLGLHAESIAFVDYLARDEKKPALEFLLKMNVPPAEAFGTSRTIVLMDATGSMGSCIDSTKKALKEIFCRAREILTENGAAASFQMQIAVYRNYNAPQEELLQASNWETETTPDQLRLFLDRDVTASYGMGNEAIEIGLWHVLEQHRVERVSQVVLIGDMPANSAVETLSNRRSQRGESYWKGTRFAEMVSYPQQLQLLVQEEIPIHAYWVSGKAQQCFTEAAKATKGTCGLLNIGSSAGNEALLDAVTNRILAAAGGNQADQLQQAYHAKYGSHFTYAGKYTGES